jgi:cardiolipin synthase
MKLPKTRNLLIALLIAVGLIAGGLVIAQDQETLRVRTSLAPRTAISRIPRAAARGAVDVRRLVLVHTNGDKAFPAMLAAIDRAKHRISFETYVYNSGETADRFTAAFEAAARHGVQVQLVLDAIGARTWTKHLERLERAGCTIGWFNKVASYSIEELNYRTHRKSLIVDGDLRSSAGSACRTTGHATPSADPCGATRR